MRRDVPTYCISRISLLAAMGLWPLVASLSPYRSAIPKILCHRPIPRCCSSLAPPRVKSTPSATVIGKVSLNNRSMPSHVGIDNKMHFYRRRFVRAVKVPFSYVQCVNARISGTLSMVAASAAIAAKINNGSVNRSNIISEWHFRMRHRTALLFLFPTRHCGRY
jgi:hypothetical protein